MKPPFRIKLMRFQSRSPTTLKNICENQDETAFMAYLSAMTRRVMAQSLILPASQRGKTLAPQQCER